MTLNTPRVRTLQDLRDFTAGSESFDLKPVSRCEAYHFIETLYQQFDYPHLGKADKGLLKACLAKVTEFSRAQLNRLLKQCRETGTVRDRRGRPGQPFPRATAATRPSGRMRTFDNHSHFRHAHPSAFRLISLLE